MTKTRRRRAEDKPLHKNQHWYDFLFEMFLSSIGVIGRMVRGLFNLF